MDQPGACILDADVRIKVIDLGCASWGGGPAGTVTQTCHYRAPEVLQPLTPNPENVVLLLAGVLLSVVDTPRP